MKSIVSMIEHSAFTQQAELKGKLEIKCIIKIVLE